MKNPRTFRVTRPAWALLALCAGCAPKSAPPAAPASPPSAPATEMASAETEASERVAVDPVFPTGPVSASPAVERFCRALHEAPARDRAACCGRPPAAVTQDGRTASECTRLLGFSVSQGAVRLDEAGADACVAALSAPAEPGACARQGRFLPAPPEVCARAVVGLRAAGAACRSNLECEGSLRCIGGGPTQLGVCGGPRPLGAPCGTGADVLATYARLSSTETDHPECDGVCAMHRCTPTLPLGGACASSLQCGPGRACIAAKCADAPQNLPVGATCPGEGCAAGLTCAAGVCSTPRAAGAACENDFQCAGACLKKGVLDHQGVCGVFCP